MLVHEPVFVRVFVRVFVLLIVIEHIFVLVSVFVLEPT